MAFTCRVQYLDDTDPFASTVFPEPTRPPSFTFNEYLPLIDQLPAVCKFLRAPHKLEDCTLQLSHNGYYLDIESSIDEQKDDFEGFIKERKHSVILRSQLSVRVHACIEKLLNSTGRELRRALFSLKQIFQDDKDLVHEFVSADGLACLIKVGTDADQNYQNYILRALGQIMLYVDGMNGVIEHTDTVQWLYSLLSSKYRLVVKTSLKLLLVFVEYSESNATVLYQATCVVDKEQGKQTWSNVMKLLKDEGQDSEILVYTMSLINKTLNAIPDQDTFYDITDSLEQEGIEETTKQLMSGKGTDLDLVEQFKLYEYSLKKEDGDIDIPVERKHNLRKHRRSAETADRKSLRRSLKPTAEYGGDRRELRRSLDLGKELTPQDADRVHDSNRRRDNRRSRPRVSIDNSSLSSEMTVKEQLEERKARLRVPDRDGSSREDTSAGTTDFSASENSSTKIPWRRGRIRQASAPGDIIANAIPQPNELRPVPASTEESVRSSEPNNVPTRQDTSPIRQDTSPIRQDTSPARQPTYDALSRTRPGSDTTSTSTRRKPEDDIATTPTRRKPTMEDDTTYTSRSRSRPSTDDSPSRVKPTEEDTTPLRRRHRPESIPESPSVSTSAATPTNTTTPTSPSETDYITERRRRRKEREAQRAAEAAAAEAAEKQTATLPRNFKPADITPPLTTTEYVSHRRRRTREDVPEETVSTNITSKPAEVSSPVENGDLSGGIAARRKLRQEQREREQLEKERLEKEQREKELAEKAKDERKDIIKRPVPIIREPTPSTSEEQDEKDKQGQRLSSPASRSKVVGMSNGDSSEAISPQISRTASPERDEVFAKTPKPSSETNHVEPSSKKTEPAKDISDKLSKEKEEAVKLTVDTTTKPEEDKVKGNEPPMSAGLSNNKRYQLAMMYSNRTSQDEATVSSPTRKVSTSLQSNETISDRIDQLRNGPVKDEDGDKESPKTPKEIEVTPGKVQAVQEKLQSPGPLSGEKEKFAGPMGDKSGAIGLAKHGLKSVNIPMKQPAVPVNKPETAEEREDAQWEEILRQNNRELRVHNWDFTDLTNQDDQNVFLIKSLTEIEGVVPAPPPLPMGGGMPPPPPAPPMMPPGHYGTLPPPPPPLSGTSINDGYNTYPPKKKKTVRLFWKETRLDRLAMYGKKDPKETIWGVLGDVTIDKRKLEHLFESKAKEILQKDQKILEAGKKHVISVLDPKRSNHINIALTALPHPSTIKQAIMKMDGTAVNKEGIEKLLTMVPSEEESNLIKEAMILNPDIPLGSAEQFLYMLSNITVLKARLSLWLFKMDYESMEEEVAEPLAELKKGIEDLKTNETFRHILSMLLAVGNFLNGAQIQGFHIDYLAKVPDIKDTVHKQSLLYHLCTMVIEQFPESSDLFSELASISRCAKVDFEVLETNLQKMEEQCTSSWEHLRVISKHDSHSPLKNRLQDFLSDCAQRIIVLKIVHRRVMNRFNQLLLYLGMTASSARETKKTEFCKIISEFALEYRTTRERVLEQEKKKANHRKRAMTRGKMITENLTLSQDKEEDAKLKALLKNHVGTAPGSETLKTRTRQKPTLGHSATTANMEDVGDEQTDEMLQILVNTAKNTKTRNTPRERKRGRTNRKSLRRTLKGGTGLTEAESRALGLHPACKTGVQV